MINSIFTSPADRAEILNYAQTLFEKMISLPKDIRSDEKERTGIQILIREIGTRNIIFAPIAEPSEAAKFFAAEKASRSEALQHLTSQDSEDEDSMKFPGSVTLFTHQVSISGLKGHEDVFLSIAVMSKFLSIDMRYIIDSIKRHGGLLPECCFDESSYHWKVL